MKFKYTLLTLFICLFIFSCEEDEEIPAPIVNINEESKGEAITFSAPDLTYYDQSEDTFVVISGGVPPYLIESSNVSYRLKEDTIFFSVRINNFVETKRINVIDNRGYNRAQFTFLTGPTFISYNLFDKMTGSSFINMTGVDSSGQNVFFSLGQVNGCAFAPKTRTFYVDFFSEDDLGLTVNLSNNNMLPDSIYFDDDFSRFGTPPNPLFDGDFEMDGTNSKVKMSYDIFGFPTEVEMDLFVKRKGTNQNKLNLKLGPLIVQ